MIEFDKCFVISLASRPTRYMRFKEKLVDSGFPFDVERFEGVVERAPDWWRLSDGMWGCARSHRILLGRMLDSNWKNMLVFEDDAFFVGNFMERLRALKVPDDWDMLYLGGRPVGKITPIDSGLVRCANINLMHAYAINRKAIDGIVKFFDSHREPQANDWRLGALHPKINAYLCLPNLVGQCAGASGTEESLFYQERIYA